MLMPVIKSAKKKLRQDKKRVLHNAKVEEALREVIKTAKNKKTAESVRLAQKAIDKAAKKHIIHANKAARIKSGLAKLFGAGKKVAEKTETKVTKKSAPAKKTSAKGQSSTGAKKPAKTK